MLKRPRAYDQGEEYGLIRLCKAQGHGEVWCEQNRASPGVVMITVARVLPPLDLRLVDKSLITHHWAEWLLEKSAEGGGIECMTWIAKETGIARRRLGKRMNEMVQAG